MLADARRELTAAARAGRGGREAQARYSDRMDGIVRPLLDSARATSPSLAVCALGGYGRRTLCLHSDIDLLILFESAIAGDEERAVNAVLRPLWDLQLVVGHHVRTLADLASFDLDNTALVLSLIDARLIAGDERMVDGVRRWQCGMSAGARAPLRDCLVEMTRHRHRQFNDTIYQLEPDIKNAPGGLRDLAAARYLQALRDDGPGADGARLAAAAREAEELLLRIRSALHAERGRDVNVLTHDLQERIAVALRCRGATVARCVEALMGAYFQGARAVSRVLSRAEGLAQPPPAGQARTFGTTFAIGPDGVYFLDPGSAASNPAVWVEIFQLALLAGCRVSTQSLDVIENCLDHCRPNDFAGTESERLQLRKMLQPRPGLYARLSQMHDCGLLSGIFPELELIHCRVVRDFYHRYTVDEHTLLTVRGLEALAQASAPGRRRFASLLEGIEAPELVTLALLLHDVGKCRDGDHALESVRIARSALDRLGLPSGARQTVEFLIRHHLQMSLVAFRRNLDDPDVIAQFAHLVGTEAHLKMLCVMTLVDLDAVSPTTLTPWKEELLWRLYVDAYNHLTLRYADELVREDPAGLAVATAGRPDDINEAELTRFLNGLPRRYLALFDLATIYGHVRLARGIHPDAVHTFVQSHGDVWTLTIVTLDTPYLFSNVCGILSYFGMDIHRGQAMTTADGLVLDVFEFADADGFLGKNAGAEAEIRRMLDRVVAGWVDVPTLLRGKEQSVVYRRTPRVPPQVHVDNECSPKYTVLEIVADDAPGLLYRISRSVSEQGCDVDLVLIATEGKNAIDVLHVTREGRKLSDAERRALKHGVTRVLEAAYEAREEHRQVEQGGRGS